MVLFYLLGLLIQSII